MKIHLISALAIFVLFSSAPKGRCYAQTTPEGRAEGALVAEFQTIAYAESDILLDFDIIGSSHGHAMVNPNRPVPLTLPFLPLLAGLHALGSETLRTLAPTYTKFFVGAKDFTPPQNLGVITSNDCYIGVSKGGPIPELASAFSHGTPETMAGSRVWTWSIPASEGYSKPTIYYGAQLGQAYLLITNNRQTFVEVAQRLTAMPAGAVDMPGLPSVTTHSYWVYRSIDQTAESGTAPKISPEAQALALTADFDKKQCVVQIYSLDHATNTPSINLPASKLIQYQSASNGVWQGVIPLTSEQRTTNSLYQIVYYFGFGVVL